MTTGTMGALGKIRERRAVLGPQIDAATREIQGLDAKIAELHKRRMDGDQKVIPQLEKVREPYDEKAHARARLVQEDGRLRVEAVRLEKDIERLQGQLDSLDDQLAAFAPILPTLETLRQQLREMDAAMIALPAYQGQPQNAYRILHSFLSQPDELLRQREGLATRLAELS
jgi:DNA repair exonuclease SbcCD ATPase subunit